MKRGAARTASCAGVFVAVVLLASVLPANVPGDPIETYYLDHLGEFTRPGLIRLHQILVEVGPDAAAEEEAAALREAERLAAEAAPGLERTSDLGREGTDRDRKGRRWGDLGWFSRGRLPQEIDRAVFGIETVGESVRVRTDLGWHVIRLTGRRKGKILPLDAVRERIEARLEKGLPEGDRIAPRTEQAGAAADLPVPILTVAAEDRLPADFPFLDEGFADGLAGALGGAGGPASRTAVDRLAHYPVIMIHGSGRDHADWTGSNCGNAPEGPAGGVLGRLEAAGFLPAELWRVRTTEPGVASRSLEALAPGLRAFILAVLRYTGAPKVQLLTHGEGGPLARFTVDRYNLAPFVHAEVHIAGPMHGTDLCSMEACLGGDPRCCGLTAGADLLKGLSLHDETPWNRAESETEAPCAVKYMTVRNGLPGGDRYFTADPASPALEGAENLTFPGLDHDGLRCADAVLHRVIPFLSDPATRCEAHHDRDGDGFCAEEKGGADCDDENSTIYPGAPETAWDGIDQDCNRMDFVGGKGALTLGEFEVPVSEPTADDADLEPAMAFSPLPIIAATAFVFLPVVLALVWTFHWTKQPKRRSRRRR